LNDSGNQSIAFDIFPVQYTNICKSLIQYNNDSGTRLRKAATPNGVHQGIVPDKVRGEGVHLGGNISEIFTWRETVVILPKPR
jgi:hypothetical protein